MRFMLNWLFTSIAIAIATFPRPRYPTLRLCRGLGLLCLRGTVPQHRRLARQAVPDGHLAAAHYYHAWYFSARSQQLHARGWPATCRSICWARVSPLPALDRPLWAASWYPSCAAFSTASPRARTVQYEPSYRPKTKAAHRKKWAAFLFAKSQRTRGSTISTPSPNAGVG